MALRTRAVVEATEVPYDDDMRDHVPEPVFEPPRELGMLPVRHLPPPCSIGSMARLPRLKRQGPGTLGAPGLRAEQL